MTSPSLILFLLCVAAGDAHLEANPVYRELVQTGAPVQARYRVRVPAPTMADGVDGSAVRAAIAGIPGRYMPVDELLRRSVVAPLVFRFRKIELPGSHAPIYGFDFWFVAYGKMDVLVKEETIVQLFDTGEPSVKVHLLNQQELTRRQIRRPTESDPQDRYFHVVLLMLDRIEVSLTSRTFGSQSTDSLLFAAMVDPRFGSDKEFANCWRPITRDTDGKRQRGAASAYPGAAMYLKITRLAEPREALFIEYHLVYAEPTEWFQGANLLRSKLPLLIQSNARTFRRNLAKASQGQ